jgi:uncharacterized protein (DUF2267 family)
VPVEEAERVACATLQSLAERISTGETEDLAEQLPPELRTCLIADGPPERFPVDEFLHRIEERAGVDHSTAERDAVAVFAALWRAVGPSEYADVRSELPKDFEPLLDRAIAQEPPPYVVESVQPVMSYDGFLELIANRAHLDREKAERAADAVLEVLATRITGGQTADLEPYLPVQLRPALERGRARTGGRARRLSVDAFLREIARGENVDRGQAAEHARAVFAALRETLPDKEWAEMRAQLPGEYSLVLKQG